MNKETNKEKVMRENAELGVFINIEDEPKKKIRQIFIIETKNGISDMELFGCLEDTIGTNILSVKESEENA